MKNHTDKCAVLTLGICTCQPDKHVSNHPIKEVPYTWDAKHAYWVSKCPDCDFVAWVGNHIGSAGLVGTPVRHYCVKKDSHASL